MSFVQYNGVSIPYAMTRVHQTGPVMDPSGSDEMYIKIRLEAEGVIDPDFRGSLPLPGGSPTGESMLKYIRHLLCQPRKRLYYDTEFGQGGTGSGGPGPNALINQLPLERDDANGPFPDSNAIEVTYTTPNVILIKFAVETYIRDCGSRYADKPLTIRWETAINFTENFQCVLTRTGTAVISSLSSLSIDTIRRSWVTPLIPRGFARKQADYQMSRDGLRCDFRFTDVQLQYAPPAPAVSLDIVQNEETTPTGVGLRNGVISVRCSGYVGSDPVRLMEIAAQVANYRLYAARPVSSPSTGIIIGGTKFSTEETIESVSVTLVRTYRTRMREITRTTAPGTILLPSSTVTSPYLPLNYGWVGYGTSRRTGYADWASDSPNAPTGIIGVRPDGVGLARAVGFFAALLRDPCGSAMATTPYATASTPTTAELRAGGAAAGGIFGSTILAAVSAAVPSPPGGGTPRSSSYWTGFLSPSTVPVAAPTGESESAAAMQADATAPPTTQALVTAVLAEYTSANPPVGLLETGNPLVAEDLAPGVYSLWQCYNEFDTDQGNVVVPVCNPLAPSVQIKHSGDVLVFRKKWTATKIGSPPVLPAIDQGSNLVLVRKYVGLPNVNVTANGTDFEYRIDGVYEYRALDPTDVRLLSDTPPFLAPSWAAKITDWATAPVPRLLADDGNSSLYAAGTIQPPAGVYDFPVSPYVNAIGTGLLNPSGGNTGGPGNPPQPGGSQPTGGGGQSGPLGQSGGSSFTTGVNVPGRSGPTPGTPVFGGVTGSAAGGGGPLGGTPGGESVVPAPPTQPEPTGGN